VSRSHNFERKIYNIYHFQSTVRNDAGDVRIRIKVNITLDLFRDRNFLRPWAKKSKYVTFKK